MLVGAGQECQEVFSPCNNDDGSAKVTTHPPTHPIPPNPTPCLSLP